MSIVINTYTEFDEYTSVLQWLAKNNIEYKSRQSFGKKDSWVLYKKKDVEKFNEAHLKYLNPK